MTATEILAFCYLLYGTDIAYVHGFPLFHLAPKQATTVAVTNFRSADKLINHCSTVVDRHFFSTGTPGFTEPTYVKKKNAVKVLKGRVMGAVPVNNAAALMLATRKYDQQHQPTKSNISPQ